MFSAPHFESLVRYSYFKKGIFIQHRRSVYRTHRLYYSVLFSFQESKDGKGQEKQSVSSSVEKKNSFDQSPDAENLKTAKTCDTIPEALLTTYLAPDDNLLEVVFVREVGASSSTEKPSSNSSGLANKYSKRVWGDLAEVSKVEHHQESNICEKNCVRVFSTNKAFSRFLNEHRENEIRDIEKQFSQGTVGISIIFSPGETDFIISGDNEKTVDQVYDQLKALESSIVSQTFETNQPGVRKFFTEGGEGERRVKTIEKDHLCVVEIELVNQVPETEKMGQRDQAFDLPEIPVWQRSAAAGRDQDAISNDQVLVTSEGIRISWKVGNIATEQVGSSKSRFLGNHMDGKISGDFIGAFYSNNNANIS